MMTKTLEELKETGEAPEWLTSEGFQTLCGGYLLKEETPKQMYQRVSKASAERLKKPELESKFFDLMWKNWLGLASPVAANMGTKRGMPISCFSIFADDSCDSIMSSMHELAMLSKHGGGVGVHWNEVRPRGSVISGNNGFSDGVVPFIKIQDATTVGISQGGVRRGASAAYLPIEHKDINEFLRIRKPQGDINRQCLNIHHGVSISNKWMQEMLDGDKEKRELWIEILKTRFETGEPYIFFSDNVNDANPECYKQNNLTVKGSNICCLSGDTLVLTKTGVSKIEYLCGKEVELWDGFNWVKNDTVSQRGVDKLFRIKFNGGFHVDCNANHRWFVLKPDYNEDDLFNIKYPGLGKSLPVEFYTEILTKDLKIGIELESVPFSGREKKDQFIVESIVELPGEHPVYCPTLPTTGKFALANGLMTGNTEITLHTDANHSFVCCLSSMNVARYDEWKNTDAVYLAIWFLDGVMQEFIDKGKDIPGFERSVRFAEKSRALGLGVFGFNTLLQSKLLPYDSMETFMLNAEMFRFIKKESEKATVDLAKEYGEPEWCKGFGRRNSHLVALAPTVSNSIISGNVSPSIEPWTSNAFARKTAKGTFIHRNKQLESLLESKGKNTEQTWKNIVLNNGSVQQLDFLTDKEKETFQTAREINQFVIIKLAAQRQRWIDQAQSINLFFPSNVDPVYFHQVHVEAWKQKLKTLYYCRTESVLKGESATRDHEQKNILEDKMLTNKNSSEEKFSRTLDECKACEG